MMAAAENASAVAPSAALTGPVARGDVETVRAHLAALADAPEVLEVYRVLSREAIPLAESAGTDRKRDLRSWGEFVRNERFDRVAIASTRRPIVHLHPRRHVKHERIRIHRRILAELRHRDAPHDAALIHRLHPPQQRVAVVDPERHLLER